MPHDDATIQSQHSSRRLRRPVGFTLLEMLITVTILAVVASLAAPMFSDDDRLRLMAAGGVLSSDIELAQVMTISYPDQPVVAVALSGSGVLPLFRRGDANADGEVDLSDAISVLGQLFGSVPAPLCLDASDTNDDSIVDVSDAVFALVWLFGEENGADLELPDRQTGRDPPSFA